jgi:EAL domain-containing protein (putative c-di-GMP-specific phosphodiesterase class I)
VETYEQYAFLREQGNAELQGYLFSTPKPASAFADPASLIFAAPLPKKAEPPALANNAAIPIIAHQAKRAS